MRSGTNLAFIQAAFLDYEDRAYGDIGMLNRFGKLVHTRKTELVFCTPTCLSCAITSTIRAFDLYLLVLLHLGN